VVLEYVLWMRERGTLAQEGKIERVTADPDDGYLVALSKASGADLIVSEDHLDVCCQVLMPTTP
jgi:predicted nucleic acid-binding protein